MEKKNKICRIFDVDEHDDQAVFPMRKVGSTTYIIIAKTEFKMFETDNTYVLEIVDKF